MTADEYLKRVQLALQKHGMNWGRPACPMPRGRAFTNVKARKTITIDDPDYLEPHERARAIEEIENYLK